MTPDELEYCKLTGYLEREYSVEWEDAQGNRWRKHAQIINLGRADRIPPADPDAALGLDGLDLDGNPQRVPQKRTQELLERITDALADKPMNVRQIAHATGQTVDRIKGILRDHRDGIVVVARGAWGKVYGLPGRTYDLTQHTPTLQRIVAHLAAHGPATVLDLADALGVHKTTVSVTLTRFAGDAVRMVGEQAANGQGGAPRQIWDITERAAA